jgi:hypothetical protein
MYAALLISHENNLSQDDPRILKSGMFSFMFKWSGFVCTKNKLKTKHLTVYEIDYVGDDAYFCI